MPELNLIKEWLTTTGVRLAIVIGLTLLGLLIAKVIAGRIVAFYQKKYDDAEHFKRATTLGNMFRWVISSAIFFTGVMLFLEEFGIEVGPLLAAAGVIGIAVGFGAQHLVQDLTNGFFMMIDDEVRVGDYVEIAGRAGMVERINLRQTVIRSFNGNVHYIPNSQIDVVTNMTKEFSYCWLEIGVAYREDIDEVFEIMEKVADSLKDVEAVAKYIYEPLEILGLDSFGDSALIVKARLKVKPITQWKVRRAYNRLLKRAFDEAGVEIPFPHLTLYQGQRKDGTAPSLNVRSSGAEGEL
ncbi:MAG: mechanosensitive ion channel family protein [bacterium]|nr:mechanosensitive ion channel family protein [bacterium]